MRDHAAVRRPWRALVVLLGAAALVPLTAAGARSQTPALAGAVTIVKSQNPANPSCTGYSSQTTPPANIRVLMSATNQIVTVPFQQYVENTLPNEWPSGWSAAALQAGAVAVKSYAWYWVNHYGGYLGTPSPSTCFDVTDDTRFQVYRPGSAVPSTTAAVLQTWNVVARNADSHQVRQASYICSLPYGSTTQCGVQGPAETCGAAANGAQLSQYGSQACARAGLDFRAILATYYFAAGGAAPLELATATPQAVSPPPAGPVTLAGTGVLVAYRIVGGTLFGSGQPVAGAAFGAWQAINPGLPLTGAPSALTAYNQTLVVYARTSSGQIVGNGQSYPGGGFTGWTTIGTGGPAMVSDPVPVLAANGALAVYALGADGNVWGSGQAAPGAAFSGWIQLSSGGGFSGRPAVLVTASGAIVIYARRGATIAGSGQSVVGGGFSGFGTIGQGAVGASGDPMVVQAADGTLNVFAAGRPDAPGAVWEASQPSAGTTFGSWRQLSAAAQYVSTPTVHVFDSGVTVVYAATAGTVQGAQAISPSGAFSAFGDMGSGGPQPVGAPTLLLAANGAMVLYTSDAGGTLWGTGQSQPGSNFSRWLTIGR
jgi:hypothetical protein